LSTLVKIPVVGSKETIFLQANLYVPQRSDGTIIFAHGSGSSRNSRRNQSFAEKLNEDGLATLLLDLLSADEEKIDNQTRELRFDIGLLSKRLISAIDWIMNNPDTNNFSIGLFGASTGAAAALVAAAERQDVVSAMVSRGGRPDLAGKDILRKVQAPTLLLVGGNDEEVLKLNEYALKGIKAERKKLRIIPGATHLFEEPGKLEEVARIASGWFRCYFLIKKHNGNKQK
jgi:dienelactone hydrolase